MRTIPSQSSRHARPGRRAQGARQGAPKGTARRDDTAAHAVPEPAAPTLAAGVEHPDVRAPVSAGAAPPLASHANPPTSAERWSAFARGFVYAGRGLGYALRTQRNMRVHLLLAFLAIALGIALRISPVEFALVFIAILLVFGTEMLNTVVETVVDLITQDYHPRARVAKDVAAGAVLLNAILAVIIALFVYVPHLWPLVAHLR